MRQPSKSIARRNEPLLERIGQFKADHPYWGYRRVWAHPDKSGRPGGQQEAGLPPDEAARSFSQDQY